MDALVDAVFCAADDPRRMSATLHAVLVAVGADVAQLTLTTDAESRSWSTGVGFHYDVTYQARVETVHAVLRLGHTMANPETNAAAVALGPELAWYFAKAFHGAARLQSVQARSRDLALVLDRVALPLLVLDGESRILHANAAAHAYLHRADGLTDADGTLVVTDTSERRTFLDTVRRSARGSDVNSQVVSLSRAHGSPLGAVVVPYAGEPRRERVLVALHDADVIDPIDASWLQRLCGLTSTERALVEALAQGATVQEFTTCRDCSEHTARSHLKSVLAKTEARRQPEVVRMLAAAPGRWV